MMRLLSYLLIPVIIMLATGCTMTYDPTDWGFRELVKATATTTTMVATYSYLVTKKDEITTEDVESIRDTAMNGRLVLAETSTQQEVLESLDLLISHIKNDKARELCENFLPQVVILARSAALDKIEEEYGEVGVAWTTLVTEATCEAMRGVELGASLYLAGVE